MATVKHFEDLKCWQEARIQCKLIYQLTKKNSFRRDFGLVDQIRRAAISTISNIAEGFCTFSNKEFVKFLDYAARSCGEIRAQLYVALDQEYIEAKEFKEGTDQTVKCENHIKAFIKYLVKR